MTASSTLAQTAEGGVYRDDQLEPLFGSHRDLGPHDMTGMLLYMGCAVDPRLGYHGGYKRYQKGSCGQVTCELGR